MIDGGLFLGRNPSNGNVLLPENLALFFKKWGMDAAIVSSYESIFFDFKEGNQKLLEFCQKHSASVIPAVTVCPQGWDSLKDADYFKHLKSRGAKLFGIYKRPEYNTVYWESPALKECVRLAAREGMAIQWGITGVADLYKIAGLYSQIDTPFLFRWMGSKAYDAISEIALLGSQNPRFYFDVGSITPSGAIAKLVESLGPERLYLASNAPEGFPLPCQFLLCSSGLDGGAFKKVAGENLKTLFGLTGPLPSGDSAKIFQHWNRLAAWPKIDTHWHLDGWNLLEPKKQKNFHPEEFERFNYQQAIISSIRALNGAMNAGNAEVFADASANPLIYGLVVVDPTRVEESLKEIKKYSDHPKCAGIKTIQDLYGLKLSDEAYRPLLEKALELDLTVMAHLPGLEEAARHYSKLKFVCAHSTWRRVASLTDLENVYFDLATSHNDAFETNLERLIREAGEDRILFASDGQLMNPSWTLGKLASLDLDQSILEKILSANAKKAFPRIKTAAVIA